MSRVFAEESESSLLDLFAKIHLNQRPNSGSATPAQIAICKLAARCDDYRCNPGETVARLTEQTDYLSFLFCSRQFPESIGIQAMSISGKWWLIREDEGFDRDENLWVQLADGRVAGRNGRYGTYEATDYDVVLTLDPAQPGEAPQILVFSAPRI